MRDGQRLRDGAPAVVAASTSRRVDASHTSGRGPTARSESVASDHPSVVATLGAIVAGSAAKT